MEIYDFIKGLNFNDFDYFYHETNEGNGRNIIDNGLFVAGNNILDVDNILFTTAAPFSEDLVIDEETLKKFLEQEKSINKIRDVSEIVIISCPKEYNQRIVSPFENYYEGTYYEGIIESNNILGYFDLNDQIFYINENYEYVNELLDDVLKK